MIVGVVLLLGQCHSQGMPDIRNKSCSVLGRDSM